VAADHALTERSPLGHTFKLFALSSNDAPASGRIEGPDPPQPSFDTRSPFDELRTIATQDQRTFFNSQNNAREAQGYPRPVHFLSRSTAATMSEPAPA
jgi:hypothetical protein